MAKYTVSVKQICEGISYGQSLNISQYIKNAIPTIFNIEVQAYGNRTYVLQEKILKAYYTNEICAETPSLWFFWMSEHWDEIMPYYNKLYEVDAIDFDIFNNIDYSREIGSEKNKDITKNSKTENIQSGSNETSVNGGYNLTHTDLYSDTPQGSIQNIQNQTYLTNGRIITDSQTNNSKSNNSNRSTINVENNGTDKEKENNNTLEIVKGKNNSESNAKLIKEYRELIINIDEMVIKDFKELFMGVW